MEVRIAIPTLEHPEQPWNYFWVTEFYLDNFKHWHAVSHWHAKKIIGL